jgi:hypothetical protein
LFSKEKPFVIHGTSAQIARQTRDLYIT